MVSGAPVDPHSTVTGASINPHSTVSGAPVEPAGGWLFVEHLVSIGMDDRTVPRWDERSVYLLVGGARPGW